MTWKPVPSVAVRSESLPVSKIPWSSTRYSPTWRRRPSGLSRWCCRKTGRHRKGNCSTDFPYNPSTIQETVAIAIALRPRFVCYSEIGVLPWKNLYRTWNSPRLRASSSVPERHLSVFDISRLGAKGRLCFLYPDQPHDLIVDLVEARPELGQALGDWGLIAHGGIVAGCGVRS